MSTMGGYAQPAPPIDREIVGMLVGQEPRSNGWVRFAILEQGRQYPVKVDTKKPEIVQAAFALGGQIVVAQIREQQSDSINPHTNQPYTNRYLNTIALAGQQQPQQQGQWGQPQGQPQQPQAQQWGPQAPQAAPQPQAQPEQNWGLTGAEKDLDIHRQVAWKCACFLAAGNVIEANPIALVEAAEVAMAYFTYGPLRFGVTAFTGQTAAGNGGHPFDEPLPEGQGAPQYEQPQPQNCPDCGYPAPQHAYGCPRADMA
jgi:hypothetical protein